jgi:tRNA-specific 2-thiouridylase
MTTSDINATEDRTAELEAVLECSLAKRKSATAVTPSATRVAVCMSGGVDSSVTALLLQKAGYDVVGLTGWLVKSGSRCCDTGMIDAARVCEQLGVEHHAVDLREMFKANIIDDFHKSYAQARTPLPCSMCNTLVKWGALLSYGKKVLGARYVATGHYGRVDRSEDSVKLARARDRKKDQSYVLWGITCEQLAETLLPLGDYTKEEIRAIAEDAGLVVAHHPDSQDLCFIPKGTTTQEYLAQFIPESPGPIVHTITGDVLGGHTGTHNFTIGQRRGIGVAYPEPLYVTSIDKEMNTVYVGPKDALLRTKLTASQVNWLLDETPSAPFRALCKIRYNSPVEPALVTPLDGCRVHVVFDNAQPAITPGQVLGIYDDSDTYILGGGWID